MMTPPNHHRRTLPQFGLLRILAWLSPGFGAAALMAVLRDSRTPLHCPALSMRTWIAGAAVVLLAVVFGWIDSILTPASHRIAGRSPRRLGFWIGFFCLFQLLVSPLVFVLMVVVAGSAGIRI
ncbi:hypothetical protein [Luteolibacter sp. Populi]|uniref:hypothetical protein n=1 Tax=Luteolibacter sp. Populi TaxID=3230487 RepID=UPI0034673503